jgi:GDP-D-mannose 3',5'-epimerase
MQRAAMVFGAGGFIGHHLVARLKKDGFWVRGVDLHLPEFGESEADEFITGDLRDVPFTESLIDRKFAEVYQLAADMGGAGYLFTGDNDAEVIFNSAQVNLNTARFCTSENVERLLFTSSACIYPMHNQLDPDNPDCAEDTAYPADPESDYGWEKLFAERLYSAFNRNRGIDVRIARYHNIFGPMGAWNNGREKAPAAVCRKVAEAPEGGSVEIWGDGQQTRSFLYIDDCLEGTIRLMRSNYLGPVNIGSEHMVTIQQLVETVMDLSGKRLSIDFVDGPVGVRGRNSNNDRARQVLGWEPSISLRDGLSETYNWISAQAARN